MRVAIDVRPASPDRVGGTATYTAQLVRALLGTRPDLDYVLVTAEDTDPSLLHDATAAGARTAQLGGRNLPRVQFGMPTLLRDNAVDVFHSPGSFLPLAWRGATVLTVHDLNVLTHPTRSLRPELVVRWLDQVSQTPASLLAARQLVAVSEATAGSIRRLTPWLAPRVTVVPNAPDPFFDDPPTDAELNVAADLAGNDLYILAVGLLAPQKRVEVVVEAIAALDYRERPNLLLVGKDPGSGWSHLATLAGRRGVLDCVRHVGVVPPGVLRALYSGAEALVMASDGEGFGLPVVEAMAAGTPVVAADRAALPEVLGGAGLLFDPDQVHTLIEPLRRLGREPGLREQLAAAGRERRGAFSWDATATATAEVYEAAARA